MLLSKALKTKEDVLKQKCFKWNRGCKEQIESIQTKGDYDNFIQNMLKSPEYEKRKSYMSEFEYLCLNLFRVPFSFFRQFYPTNVTYGFNKDVREIERTEENANKYKGMKDEYLDKNTDEEFKE